MNSKLVTFLRAKKINSFQKLHFLLFLHQNPNFSATTQELANRLYFGNTLLLENIITDLQKVGLLEGRNNKWRLSDEPDTNVYLQRLRNIFEDPVARQKLIDYITPRVSFSY